MLLDRLDKVRQVGEGRWKACCPAHDDRSPSLAVTEKPDGIILIKCWTGCGAADVVAAIGLSMSDLFPDKLSHHMPAKRDRQHWHMAKEALISLDRDALLITTAIENVCNGVYLNDKDRLLVCEAVRRINEARGLVAGWK